LALTGCQAWDSLFLDDAGRPSNEEQELGWFLVNVLKLVFADPLRFLGIVGGIFLLLLVGGMLWLKGGIYKVIGVIMVVVGITVYCCIVGLAYLVLAIFLAVLIGGVRRN
jgi:hypothetical protein